MTLILSFLMSNLLVQPNPCELGWWVGLSVFFFQPDYGKLDWKNLTQPDLYTPLVKCKIFQAFSDE